MAAASRRFPFVQWEFPGRLGPEPGRYVVRRFAGDDVRHIVVFGGQEAPRRRRRTPRRPEKAAAGAGPPAVEVTRATVIDMEALGEDEPAAAAWLKTAAGAGADATLAKALAVLNRAIHSHRLAAADPYVSEVVAQQAVAVRIGYGTGEQVADGRWDAATELRREDRRDRSVILHPQERLAALLSGRDAPLACEVLALRGRLDLDQGRGREAALQVAAALETALAELEGWRGSGGMGSRIDELAGQLPDVRAAASAALAGGLDAGQTAAVDTALKRLESALRARVAGI